MQRNPAAMMKKLQSSIDPKMLSQIGGAEGVMKMMEDMGGADGMQKMMAGMGGGMPGGMGKMMKGMGGRKR